MGSDFYINEEMEWELLPNGNFRKDSSAGSRLRRIYADFWNTAIVSPEKEKSPVDSSLMTDRLPLYAKDRARQLNQPLIEDETLLPNPTIEVAENDDRIKIKISQQEEGETVNIFETFVEVI